MEILQSLYQQRLNSLANSFFDLLQQLEKTISPFSEPQLAHHRIEYLKHVISTTLDNDREKFIKELFEEIQSLKGKLSQQACSLNEQPFVYSKELSRNSTCSRESSEWRDSFDRKYQSNGFQNSKKSQSRNPSSFEQTYFDGDASMCESTVTSVLKKKGAGSRSQTSITMENELKNRMETQSKKEEKFEFKYLRIPKY